ncbi:hypothetical protein VTK73DRAFT_610 [Phialemonium thermophilum]|uniref:Methyltransferase type 11 domain-containing protein n=1 Tax=Phialemonium thermophilum TaxID=223376 RepID=A0ABR3XEF3_9PEZI
MSDLILLASASLRPPSPSGRMKGRLNPIMEEEPEDCSSASLSSRQENDKRRPVGDIEVAISGKNVGQWLSPLSDHFPTPRGFHFLSAPIVPATPSAISDEGDANDASSISTASNPSVRSWSNSRDSVMTDSTEFDDISDDSEDEASRKERLRDHGISRQDGSKSSRSSRGAWRASMDLRKSLAPLVIPESRNTPAASWTDARMLMKVTSPVPPTPSSKVELSPVHLAFMQAQQEVEVPPISAAPSLAGSLNSEEMAAISAPPTPLIGSKNKDDDGWTGVQLQPGALATLQALSVSDDFDEGQHQTQQNQLIEVPQEEMAEMRQHASPLITNVRPTSASAIPARKPSLAGLTKLDIPSPGGFFAGLSSASRSTWHVPNQGADDPPPTSTTAEQFYKSPWNRVDSLPGPPPRTLHLEQGDFPSNIVERVIEILPADTDALPTAVPIQTTPQPVTARRIPPLDHEQPDLTRMLDSDQYHTQYAFLDSTPSPGDATEIIAEYEPGYTRKQQEAALSHANRTEMWLTAQRVYLNHIVNFGGEGERTEAEEQGSRTMTDSLSSKRACVESEPDATGVQKKKTVRFSEIIQSIDLPKRLPSKLFRQDSVYYRAFIDLIIRSHSQDVFVHRLPRFEALQAQRVSLREAHRNQLLGKYQLSVVPQSAKKRMSANVVRGDDVLVDDPDKLRADQEREALQQMSMAAWHVAAMKMLSDGRLVLAPAAKRLARQSLRVGKAGRRRDRVRILDLGGHGACDWAWHAALAFPGAKVYTVTTKAIRRLSNCNVRGPPNHRLVAVDRLTRLPFLDKQFDLISARELHSVLKYVGENGEDEWESCLAECERVLKPGGYIDFNVLDSDLVNPGPLALARSVEFGFTLKTLGYDPSPSRFFISRLSRAGFVEIRRAWVCLPMGHRSKSPAAAVADKGLGRALQPDTVARVLELEAMVTGSTENAAPVAGFAGGWSWERWLMRTEMERAAGELRLADTVTSGDKMRQAGEGISVVRDIVEEGRASGAAYRMLRGYARKPDPAEAGAIRVLLDTQYSTT